ncbi:MAG TPA: bifunctional 5,10-methylenetetrahydrofolate dehydrogenase/5,10-methenyltetrahydrofolate cyclohydrolase [Candidatus Omnitrophota bacterium]|nr:bifunctional 5,10-methylenetetrahydrofolate dehydrogenase/5,10-methenyltetrahydrofolate cyclohydrolase [Candidatus Omnitrophota bacterium]
MTEAILLEGKKVGEAIRQTILAEVSEIKAKNGETLRLACVAVGEDPASKWYRQALEKTAKSLGIEFENVLLEAGISQSELSGRVRELGFARGDIHGILVQDPLPEGINQAQVLSCLNPKKDVEGIHPENLGLLVMRKGRLIPATALSCLALIDATGIGMRGKAAVIVGQSTIVGRPLQLLLGERRALTIVCNTGTSREQMEKLMGLADVVVACCGQPRMIPGQWVRDGSIVIDAGTTEVDGKIVGDIEFEEARKKARFITPVPGGVGPLTVLMLMKNLISAYHWQKE